MTLFSKILEYSFGAAYKFLNYSWGGNTVKRYLIGLAVFIVALFILKLFEEVGKRKIKKIINREDLRIDDLVKKIIDCLGWPLYIILALYFSLQFLELGNIGEKTSYYVVLITVAFYIGFALQRVLDFGLDKIGRRMTREEDNFDPSLLKVLSKIIKGVLWVGIVLIILQNMGYNVSALLAGIGIGGVAIALALQSILGDIFASFSIYFDRPFQTGDFIIVGDDMGTVKKIGIKTTRLQALEGEELVISNKELTSARVHNYKRMEKRRIVFKLGVEYETPAEKLRKIPGIVKEIIDSIEIAELDRAHFKNFGDFSLNYEIVYYLASNDYNEYMNTQQKINLMIKERFEKEKIGMAFPTQTIYLNK